MPVEVSADVEEVPPAVATAVYFVVAEALTNVAKYAGARSAIVTVETSDGLITAIVSDDGVGGADPAAGSGLRGLLDRVAALDGRLELESPPGGGTRLAATFPLRAAHIEPQR